MFPSSPTPAAPLLLFSACRDLYGSERALLDFVNGLPPALRDTARAFTPPGRLARELAGSGCHVSSIPSWPSPVGRLLARVWMTQRLRLLRARAAYFNEASLLRLALALTRRRDVPVTVHVRTVEEAAFVSRLCRNWQWGDRLRFVCISQFIAAHVTTPETSKVQLYDGFRRLAAKAVPETLSNRPPRVCIIGRVTPRKGPEFVIRALASHTERLRATGVFVDVVGDVSAAYRHFLSTLIRDSGLEGLVTLSPFTSDAAELYRGCRLVILPGLAEGLGRTWFEALQLGHPVLVASDGGPAELCRRHQLGVIYRAGDAADFAATLFATLARLDEATSESRSRSEEVLRHYEMSAYVNQLLGIVLR